MRTMVESVFFGLSDTRAGPMRSTRCGSGFSTEYVNFFEPPAASNETSKLSERSSKTSSATSAALSPAFVSVTSAWTSSPRT